MFELARIAMLCVSMICLLACCPPLFAGSAAQPQSASPSPMTPADIDQAASAALDESILPIPSPPPANPAEVALGARLFQDPSLSHGGDRSCGSCHDVRRNGSDGGRNHEVSSDGRLSFMTLSVFNAALNFRLNWRGQFRSLEAQAEASLTDPAVMAMTPYAAVAALTHEPGMPEHFQAVYGHGPRWDNILSALAAYERSLLTPDSRFDRWLRGDALALSPQELAGYQLFKSFGCISCHQGINVGGNLFEQSGVFHPISGDAAPLLRVPSLRNIAMLAPYFHDGSAPTLFCAVRKMAYVQLNRQISADEITAIVGFLNSLTGLYDGRPLSPVP